MTMGSCARCWEFPCECDAEHERTGRNVAFAFAMVAACWLGEQAERERCGYVGDYEHAYGLDEAEELLRATGLWVTR